MNQEPISPPSLPDVPPSPLTEERILVYRGLELDRFQAEAIAHLRAGRSVLVTAPTGTGKTIIADYVVEQAIKLGRSVVYTAPIKALSNQKYRDYTRLYGKSCIGLVTGDLVINQDAQVRIMTTEILRNILLQGGSPRGLSHVIIDEAHFLDDVERGTVWEEMLIYLPREVKIVALSATLPNVADFVEWLGEVRGETVAVVHEDQRAVPLKILMANRDTGIVTPRKFAQKHKAYLDSSQRLRDESSGSRRQRDRRRPRGRGGTNGDMTRHLDIIAMARPDYLPALYFVFSRRHTEIFARDAARQLHGTLLPPEARDAVADRVETFEKETPDVLTPEHRRMYLQGIAFHHAGLHVSLKALVEELYERKLVYLLYCTSTFALGINMPARTVIFDGLRKFNGVAIAPLTVRQFQQKAGRAGRRGMDEVGYVIIREDFESFRQDRPLLDLYRRGEHEQISSAFNLSFSSVVNLLDRYSESEIRTIIDRSFLNFHHRKALTAEQEELDALKHRIELAESGQFPTPKGRQRGEHQKRWRQQARKLTRTLTKRENALYARFTEKVDFLKLAGYIADDGSFDAGAHALMHVQINELFVTELLLEGIFEELDADELFGVLTAMVIDLPRQVQVRHPMPRRLAYLRNRIRQIHTSPIVMDGAELMGAPVPFCPELMPFGFLWSKGESLAHLMRLLKSDIDVSGDLVGAFRRAKDLAGQLRTVYRDDDFMRTRLTSVIKTVSRDEVEVID